MISRRTNPEELFYKTKDNILCNTSYPFNPKGFALYRSKKDIMENSSHLSFYFHIPFCSSLCKFCEYTRFLLRDREEENDYINKLIEQFKRYAESHVIECLYGMDIGGGTPTALSVSGLDRLLSIINEAIESYNKAKDFEPSLEFHYSTMDKEKAKVIGRNGIHRCSTGIQIFDSSYLDSQNRQHENLQIMKEKNNLLRNNGVNKINIDLMYGLLKQSDKQIQATISAISELLPEQVTLYETRYNQTNLTIDYPSRETVFDQYKLFYSGLISLGYSARFGSNAFSRIGDTGLSSYIKYRMERGLDYKGFGISAQSMSKMGISYNNLKGSHDIHIPNTYSLEVLDNYLLPREEIAAKYVCVALYGGRFSNSVLSNILGTDAESYFKQEFAFLKQDDLIYKKDDYWNLTQLGFKYYGGVGSLFWSERQKTEKLKSLENI